MKNKLLFFAILFLLIILVVISLGLYDKFKDKAPTTNLIVYTSDDNKATSPGGTVSGTTNQPTPSDNPSDGDGTGSNDQGTGSDSGSTNQSGSNSGNQNLPLAPDFTVYDRDGNPVKLSDFRGKPVVLNFWASWCGPCKSEMPDFNQTYLEIGDEVQFLMVNLTDGSYETLASATSFIDGKGYSFPVFYDTSSSAANAYSVYSIPATFFIDAEGHLVAHASGAISADTLMQGIDMIR